MRPITKFAFLPVFSLVLLPVSATPLMAQDAVKAAPIEFVTGTGPANAVNNTAPALALAEAPVLDDNSAEDMERMAAKMADPKMQDSVAHMVEGMTEMMMHLPVGQFTDAIEKARPGSIKKRLRGDATLADLAGRDAKNLPEKLGKESRTMMAMMGGFTKAFATMLPELEKMGAEMEAGFKDADKASREQN
jgi:hypothetical protein